MQGFRELTGKFLAVVLRAHRITHCHLRRNPALIAAHRVVLLDSLQNHPAAVEADVFAAFITPALLSSVYVAPRVHRRAQMGLHRKLDLGERPLCRGRASKLAALASRSSRRASSFVLHMVSLTVVARYHVESSVEREARQSPNFLTGPAVVHAHLKLCQLAIVLLSVTLSLIVRAQHVGQLSGQL